MAEWMAGMVTGNGGAEVGPGTTAGVFSPLVQRGRSSS